MAGLAETIVLGNKLYQAGKIVKRSIQGVSKGLQSHNKQVQKQTQRQPQKQVQKQNQAPKMKQPKAPASKPAAKPKTGNNNNIKKK